MNIKITHFTSPFSFFCKVESDTSRRDASGGGAGDGEVNMINSVSADTARMSKISRSKSDISDFNHGQGLFKNKLLKTCLARVFSTFLYGTYWKPKLNAHFYDTKTQQYVAVTWKDKWVRGIVTMESQFLIWLVDYGFYLRPNDKTVFIDLPAEYRKSPTKVFEASIHGVCPVDKVFTDDCQIINEMTTTWNKGAIEKAQSLIADAMATYFVPIALLNTKQNDIVLGDLYLQFVGKGFVNIYDELVLWPMFLEKNQNIFVKYLPVNFTSRRKHRASTLPPEFPDFDYKLPLMSLATSLQEYKNICENAPTFEPTCEYDSQSEDGSTVASHARARRNSDDEYKLTHAEILTYSKMFVTIHDREYNVLSILLSKLQDLRMCERYKNHDLKRIGRACSRRRTSTSENE